MPVGAAVAVAGIAGAGASIYSANKAASAQTNAANQAAAVSQQNTDKANALLQAAVPQANALIQPGVDSANALITPAIDKANALSSASLAKAGTYAQPYMDTGANASSTLNKLMTPGTDMTGYLASMPGQQFLLSQGMKGMDNRYSAIGGGGNRDRAGIDYATGVAQQNYNNVVNQLQTTAGLGATTAANLGGQTISVGNTQGGNIIQGAGAMGSNIMTGAGAQAGNIMAGAGAQGSNLMTAAGVQGNALIGAGNAQGAAAMAEGNAVASGANSVANYYQQNALMNKYLSAKGGGSTMYGGANSTGLPWN